MNIGGLKVMVIDDSKTIRRTAETLLKKAGCEVLTATDGFEALSIIADNHPDLICRYHDATPGWLSDVCADKA